MGNPQKSTQFRINPVEMTIFSVVAGLFCYSVYHLFYDQQGFQAAALAPMAASPIRDGRAPASVAPLFTSLDVKCDTAMAPIETQATKVRLSGPLCGTTSSGAIKTLVTNSANQFTATVFTDSPNLKFSTDYIPLNAGKNPIRIQYVHSSGRTESVDLEITKRD